MTDTNNAGPAGPNKLDAFMVDCANIALGLTQGLLASGKYGDPPDVRAACGLAWAEGVPAFLAAGQAFPEHMLKLNPDFMVRMGLAERFDLDAPAADAVGEFGT